MLLNSFSSFGMGGRVGEVNEEIIHINDKSSFCDHVAKGVIHEVLESGRGISETEEHHSWFEESFMGDKGGFPLMPVFDLDIIVPPSDIEFGEDFCPLEFINKVRNEWERVCATDRMFVNVVIVLAGLKATILLFDKEERGCLWGVGGADFAGS